VVVLYQFLSWNETSKRRSYVLREIMDEQANSSRSMNNVAAEVESSTKGDAILLLDRESLYQQKEERNGALPHPGYVKDAFQTIFPLLDNLNGTTLLLTQWGDAPASKVLRYGQLGAPPTYILNPALPIIKKFRSVVVSRDELDRVTSADCYMVTTAPGWAHRVFLQ
jgi:hypothetical protein